MTSFGLEESKSNVLLPELNKDRTSNKENKTSNTSEKKLNDNSNPDLKDKIEITIIR